MSDIIQSLYLKRRFYVDQLRSIATKIGNFALDGRTWSTMVWQCVIHLQWCIKYKMYCQNYKFYISFTTVADYTFVAKKIERASFAVGWHEQRNAVFDFRHNGRFIGATSVTKTKTNQCRLFRWIQRFQCEASTKCHRAFCLGMQVV